MSLTEDLWPPDPTPGETQDSLAALFARSHVGPAPTTARRARVYAGLEALRAETGDDRLFVRATAELLADTLLDRVQLEQVRVACQQGERIGRGLAQHSEAAAVLLAAALRWALESEEG